MALYVLGNFEYAHDYEVPELPQVVFMEMLLNDAITLGVLSGWMILMIESAVKELRWNAFQVWPGCNRGKIMEGRRQEEYNASDEEVSSGSDDQTPLTSDDSKE